MKYRLKVYTSTQFLLKLDEFKHRTIQEFGTDIDIESYLFFKNIIFNNEAQIITDLKEEEIRNYKEINLVQESSHEKVHLIRMIQSYKSQLIKSDNGLIQKIRDLEVRNLSHDDLPNYLFIGNVSEEICRDIEATFGIVCYSLKRMTVEKSIRQVKLTMIRDTKKSLYEEINKTSFNTIHLNDPYFNEKLTVGDSTEIVHCFLKRSAKFKTLLKAKITTAITGGSRSKPNQMKIFETEFKRHIQASSFSLKLSSYSEYDGKYHDRYIFSNKHIIIIGNSLFTSTPTHYTSLPLGIYFDFLSEDDLNFAAEQRIS